MYIKKNLGKICITRKSWPKLYKFSLGFIFCIFYTSIIDIIPHSPDDGSLELKCYSVDFASTWIPLLSIFLYILSDCTPLFTSKSVYTERK